VNPYRLANAALQDVFDIVDYIAVDNLHAAENIRDLLFATFDRLAERPEMGHLRRDLTDQPLRFWTVARRYVIAYRSDRDILEIARVFGPGRDIAALLR
jgi:antitoxin ParD1/3/4/toxin ParE1/3/4